ncbi:hypothetical protein HPB47_026180 [Ixodes persulcatus]|uniref:Uncharacterized protein n=1 Tax=Ixodes persulcatus TaxID=34615 RepID=A0AC60Q190_IXOPE|nr:hypothetical protein HPB47_026180 [Ixodes persulcatus]
MNENERKAIGMLRLSVYADKHHQSFAPINIIHHSSKEHLTVLLCRNEDGPEKMKHFLRYLDSRMGLQNRKALLLIGNCPAQPKITPTKLTILDAMHFFATAWGTVSITTVQHCFRKCGFERARPGRALRATQTKIPKTRKKWRSGSLLTYSECLSVEENVVTSEPLSLLDIVNELTTADVLKFWRLYFPPLTSSLLLIGDVKNQEI